MPSPRPHTPARPWAPLSDLEWHALYPFIHPRVPLGRQVGDLRRRMDAIFHVACSHAPWKDVPERYGKPDTVSRFYRRLTHAGLWQKLLEHLVELEPEHPLRWIEAFIVKACRRAHRILGMAFLLLIRRLDIHAALNGPPWMLPNPDLSEKLLRHTLPAALRGDLVVIRLMRRLLRTLRGRKSIPRCLRLAWP